MVISLIVALAKNNVIGKKNKMPWHLPADLAWFKKNTLHKPIIMGRKTFASIKNHPLPHRLNIVITRNPTSVTTNTHCNLIVVSSLKEAITASGNADEVMVIGGGDIFKQALHLADRLYLTYIDSHIDGDTFFPDYHQYQWQSVFNEHHQPDEKNGYAYQFTILHRIKNNYHTDC